MEHMETVKQMLTAHEYFKLKGLSLDLILLNDFAIAMNSQFRNGYEMIAVSHARELIDKPGGVFIRQSTNIPEADLIDICSRQVGTKC